MITSFRTTVRGRTIELPWDLGLPPDRVIEVTIKTCPEVESPPEPPLPPWMERLEVNPAVHPGKFVVKGTKVRADTVVDLLAEGKSEEEVLRTHSELTSNDIAAVREYAKVSKRRPFTSAAEEEQEAKEWDEFLEWNRQQRKMSRPRDLEP